MDNETTPVADYDSPWKEALAHYLPDAFALFFPEVHAQIDWRRGYELLDKELQQVTRDADLGRRLADTLVQVWRADGSDAWVLIHIEVQGQPERDFARRMFVYYYRIFDRYDHPIISVAILGDEQPDWRPARYSQELWGCALELRYPVVKLLDWRERDAELGASANPFALVVRAYLTAQATAGDVEARGRAKLELIRGLYERGYERQQILELFRLIDWLVALPPEQDVLVWREITRIEEERRMPYITSVERIGLQRGEQIGRERGEQIGLQRGEQIGLERGEQIGLHDGQRAMLRRFLQVRFGTVPEALGRQIDAADQLRLEQLADQIGTATSLEELDAASDEPA
ncbi:MAG: Rpn family recombination-promoting nuclease/putative transposase [Chloroflexota bacterium]